MTKHHGSLRNDLLLRLLRAMRKNIGLTQAQLAMKLGKPQSFVSKYEIGERRLDILEVLDICVACDSSLEDFSQLICTTFKQKLSLQPRKE